MALFKGHWQLIALIACVFALWSTPVMIPLKILVVFLHEASHAVMALLTGGEVLSLSVSPNEGGLVVSRGGSRFWTLTAGYLGSLLIGLALLIAALRSTADRVIVAACGIAMLAIAALYIREVFAAGFAIATGVALLAMARFLNNAVCDITLRVIGLTSMIYVPFDIISDTLTRAHLRSDARMLAEEFGGTTQLWGGLWLVISLCAIAAALRFGLGADSNLKMRPRGM